MAALIIDIETGPIPDSDLEKLFEFTPNPKWEKLAQAEFNPDDVKTGNTKDPEKIAAKIDEARKKFEKEKSEASVAVLMERDTAWESFKSSAALSAIHGQLLAVGMYCNSWGDEVLLKYQKENVRSEHTLLVDVLSMIEEFLNAGNTIVGHNIIGFDIPFMLRRGMKYGIAPPPVIKNQLIQYRSTQVIDMMREWQFGNRSEKFVSLNTLANFFGTTSKNGSGADFHHLFWGDDNERITAMNYMRNDIVMTREIAEQMQLIPKGVSQ